MLICTVFILKFFLFYVTYEARRTIVKEELQVNDMVHHEGLACICTYQPYQFRRWFPRLGHASYFHQLAYL